MLRDRMRWDYCLHQTERRYQVCSASVVPSSSRFSRCPFQHSYSCLARSAALQGVPTARHGRSFDATTTSRCTFVSEGRRGTAQAITALRRIVPAHVCQKLLQKGSALHPTIALVCSERTLAVQCKQLELAASDVQRAALSSDVCATLDAQFAAPNEIRVCPGSN